MLAWQVPEPPRPEPPAAAGPVRVFDTATAGLVEVGGAGDRPASMYVCGITPYDATHLGHANTYVGFDLLHRVWRDAGRPVRYVQNVTDVDDPLLERAAATGVDWRRLAEEQTQLFREDMAALNVLPPTALVGAVESVPRIVPLVQRLLTRGAAYAVSYPVPDPEYDDVYLSADADPAFGSVARLPEAEARTLFAERGGDPDRPGKKNPLDSLLWRQERPGEPAWASALGRGRPGWHVECAAIALDLLGPDFDVQGGGSDLAFPHHEMSASTARLATDRPFARTYVHSGMVGLDGEKMSKSRGNLVLVSRLRAAGTDPAAIRLALLAAHYRADWTWTDDRLADAQRRLARWRAAVGRPAGPPAAPLLAAVRAALADDLDAPTALAAVDGWAAASGADPAAPRAVADACDALLGVRL